MAASSSLLAFALVAVVALFIGILFPIAHAQVAAPAPAPTSDGQLFASYLRILFFK